MYFNSEIHSLKAGKQPDNFHLMSILTANHTLVYSIRQFFLELLV